MKTRNQDIAMMILEKLNPNNRISIYYSSEADSIDVYRFINDKESEGRHLSYLADDHEACTFYEEVVEWIDSEENDVIENIDYQQELFAEHEEF
ncbi:hypothetical protein Aargi30884_27600 [Amedibacterium intestinale]|jgi:hypothetical protein|uniref:Uncharacterized protein n=1 Tax=Amedibacterium intestinale TaxID=2583452 RepID=A0A6N4TMB1_9FIRM|nr:hypothetical protein [Amedibacterium intestinale]BBK23857.1 hypothetical protein Aargi30884_27600 [Amedibacterium intestinale]DAQ11632.1 MAG TPA: hypothetical protein [Caudoviricetes sp.]